MKYVGIAAYSGEAPVELVFRVKEFIDELTKCLKPEETAVVVGGYWGLMKFVVDECLGRGFKIIIVPPIELENIRFPKDAIVVKSGTSYRLRSVILVRTSDVLVALGGGGGTIQEVVTAYDEGKPIFVLGNTGMPTDNIRMLAPFLDDRRTSKIEFLLDPRELARAVCRLISNERK